MKKQLTFLLCIGFSLFSFAGWGKQLWGTTNSGGDNKVGVIFHINPDGSGYQKVYSFAIATGFAANGRLLMAVDGNFYGTTNNGGKFSNGVIYRFNPHTNVYTDLHDFNGLDGKKPFRSALIQGKDGRLYGVTDEGGISNVGVIFAYDPASSTYTKLYDFEGNTGRNPRGGLLQASNGKLYGTTYNGGITFNEGVMFSFDIQNNLYTDIRDFNAYYEGTYPVASLVEGANARIFGAFSIGTSETTGWIFSTNTNGGNFNDHRFLNQNSGSQILTDFVISPLGKIYGEASAGGLFGKGTIFQTDTVGKGFVPEHQCTSIHDFNGTDGTPSMGGLMLAFDGKLYGMTTFGGDFSLVAGFGGGVIYCLDPTTYTYSVLHMFDATNGYQPWGTLVETDPIFAGIEEVNPTRILKIYPNPAGGTCMIEVPDGAKELRVFNALGEIVLAIKLQSSIVKLNLYKAGIYFVQADGGRENFLGKLFIIK